MSTSLALSVLYAARVPTFLWGPSGVGKSEVLKQMAEQAGVHFHPLSLTQIDPTLVGGVVVPRGDYAARIPLEGSYRLTKKEGILFLDEFNLCPVIAEGAALEIVAHRVVGDISLHPKTWIVAAGNPPTSKGFNGRWLSKPATRRFCHIQFHPNKKDWIEWMNGGTGACPKLLPKEVEQRAELGLSSARSMVAAWAEREEDNWEQFQRDAKPGEIYPTRAGAVMAAQIIAVHQAVSDFSPDWEEALRIALVGCLGTTAPGLLDFVSGFNPWSLTDLPVEQWPANWPERADRLSACLKLAGERMVGREEEYWHGVELLFDSGFPIEILFGSSTQVLKRNHKAVPNTLGKKYASIMKAK